MNKKWKNFLKTSNKLKISIISIVVAVLVGGGIVFAAIQPYSSFAWITSGATIQADKLHGNLLFLKHETIKNTALITTIRDTVGSSPWTTTGTNINRTTGNVGIGTTTPTQKLDVTGSIRSTGNTIINNSSPRLFLQDTNQRSAMILVNSNQLFILGGSGNNSLIYQSTDQQWPLIINLNNNDASFGGNIRIRQPGKGIVFPDGSVQWTATRPTSPLYGHYRCPHHTKLRPTYIRGCGVHTTCLGQISNKRTCTNMRYRYDRFRGCIFPTTTTYPCTRMR